MSAVDPAILKLYQAELRRLRILQGMSARVEATVYQVQEPPRPKRVGSKGAKLPRKLIPKPSGRFFLYLIEEGALECTTPLEAEITALQLSNDIGKLVRPHLESTIEYLRSPTTLEPDVLGNHFERLATANNLGYMAQGCVVSRKINGNMIFEGKDAEKTARALQESINIVIRPVVAASLAHIRNNVLDIASRL
jgi:hypothetical protein